LTFTFPIITAAYADPLYVGTKFVYVSFGYWTSDIPAVAGNDNRILVGEKLAKRIADWLAGKGIRKTVISTVRERSEAEWRRELVTTVSMAPPEATE
jgi:hypothetical protein